MARTTSKRVTFRDEYGQWRMVRPRTLRAKRGGLVKFTYEDQRGQHLVIRNIQEAIVHDDDD